MKKVWNEQKKVENDWKKEFNQILGAHSTQKLVEVHNRLSTIKAYVSSLGE